jgi:hypothetical protein
MALVELRRFYSSFEAHVVRSALEVEGIPSFLFDIQMNWGGLDGAVPVRLMVDDEDQEEASQILCEAERDL